MSSLIVLHTAQPHSLRFEIQLDFQNKIFHASLHVAGNNKAIKRLLHVAVSDVNDDVRRAAVMSLGFLLFKTPEQCPGLVSLLSESYNPHVR